MAAPSLSRLFYLLVLAPLAMPARAETSATAAAVEASTLELEDVLTSVRQHHPVILAERAKLEAARADVLAARGAFDTKLSVYAKATPLGYYDPKWVDVLVEQPTRVLGATVYGGYRVTRGKVAPYYGERNTLDHGELRGGIRVPLLQNRDIDDYRADLQRAELSRTGAENDFQQAMLDLYADAAEAYFEWAAAYRREQVIAELVELANTRNAQVAEKVDLGALPDLERIDNMRSLLDRKQKLISARRKREKAAIYLSLYARDEQGRPRAIAPELSPSADIDEPRALGPLQDAQRSALERRPVLKSQRASIGQAQVDRELARNQLNPKLDATLEVSRDFGSQNPDLAPTLAPTVLEAGVVLSMPLWLRKARGKLKAATAKLQAAQAKADYVRDKVLLELQDAYSQLEAAEDRLAIAVQGRDAARQVAQGERERFELGASTIFVVNQREQTATDAELSRIDAAQELAFAAIRALLASGDSLAQ